MNLGQWIGSIVLFLSLYVLWELREILLLVFAATIVATALNVFVRQLQRRLRVRRPYAVAIALFLLLAVCATTFAIIVPPFAEQFQELTRLVLGDGVNPSKVQIQLEEWVEQIREISPAELDSYLPEVRTLIEQVPNLINELWKRALEFLSGTFGVVLNLLLAIVLTIMLLADPQPYRRAFVRLFPSFYRRRTEEILDKCEVALEGWLCGILFNMSVIAVFSWIGLSILQVRLAFAHGVLAGLLTFIPNIGPALSIIPPVAIAVLDGPWKPVSVLILYFAIQQLEGNLLTPYVMAHQVSLLPAVTLFAQVVFATFFGFLGLLLALPLAVVVQTWIQELLVADVLDRWHLISEDGPLSFLQLTHQEAQHAAEREAEKNAGKGDLSASGVFPEENRNNENFDRAAALAKTDGGGEGSGKAMDGDRPAGNPHQSNDRANSDGDR